jgi:hypothetical protein
MFTLPVYVIYLLLTGCATTQQSGTSSSAYSEDLSALRPVFEEEETQSSVVEKPKKRENIEPEFTVNESLHAVLDSIDRINLTRKLIDGFSIQIYSGQKREDALDSKRTMDQHLPELNAEMIYVQPTFRIKAGRYYTQLDAQKDFVAVKRYFPNAILIPDKIAVD